MKKRAQSAIEFVILIGVFIFIFLIFLFVLRGNISGRAIENENFAFQELTLAIQDEINLAIDATEGYYREFEIPQKVFNRDYDITIINEFIYLSTTDGKYGISFPIANVTGYLQKGTNIIRKEGGKVFINVAPN